MQIDLNKLAGELDGLLSPDGKTGFLLLTFPREGGAGECEFITNAPRAAVMQALKDQLKHLRVQQVMGLAPVPISTKPSPIKKVNGRGV